MSSHFTLPIFIDLTATCLYAMTGALLAIRRHYDVIGLFVLAIGHGVAESREIALRLVRCYARSNP